VFEVCGREYLKTKDKLAKVEKEVEELREQILAQGEADEESAEKLNERMGTLMGGRSSNDRRWRDAQLAYANMLSVRFGLDGFILTEGCISDVPFMYS
jgi:hypothetical protein